MDLLRSVQDRVLEDGLLVNGVHRGMDCNAGQEIRFIAVKRVSSGFTEFNKLQKLLFNYFNISGKFIYVHDIIFDNLA